MTVLPSDSESLAEGQQIITACVFIHQQIDGKEKVFIAKRADTKRFLPGVYELIGGHIEFGEDPILGLKREVNEELGAEVKIGDPFFVFAYTNDIKKSHSIEVVYFAKFITDPNDIKINPEDHSECGWFSEDELHLATSPTKGLEDIEFQAMLKGFALLRGEGLNF